MRSVKLIAAKAGQLLIVLWAVATVLFFIFRLMPGNPLAAFIDPSFTQEQQTALMREFGLDKPLFQQYLIYLVNLLHLDFGVSFFYHSPVSDLVFAVFPNTLLLTFSALIVAYVVGILLGALVARQRGTWIEAVMLPIVLVLRAAPEFWVGMILLAIFSFSLGWFPAGGATSAGAEFGGVFGRLFTLDFLAHLFLPALTLALYLLGLPLLLMRSTMLEVLRRGFRHHGAHEGLSGIDRGAAPCGAQRAAAGGDRLCARHRLFHRRQCGDRDRLFLARARPPAGRARCRAMTIRWPRAPSC